MSLPPRGTGLARGTARPRSWPPLTESQRMARHTAIYGLGNGDTALMLAVAEILLGAGLILGLVMLK